MSFAEFLGEALRVRGWSTYKLSEVSGVAPSTIKGWLYGGREPNMGNAQKVANAFGISVEELYAAAGYEVPRKAKRRVEKPEELRESLRLIEPISIPVYRKLQPYPSGKREEPVKYIFRRREIAVGRNIEAYIIKGQYLRLEIGDGDIVLVDRDLPGEAGDVVLGLFEGQTIIGLLEREDGELWLISDGRKIKFGECQGLSKVIEIRKKFE